MEDVVKGNAPQLKGRVPKPSAVFKDFAEELKATRPDGLTKGFLIAPGSGVSNMQSTLYIKAGNPWMLEHRSEGQGGPLVGQWLPAGEYRLTFTSHSVALDAVVIDPEPSGGYSGPKRLRANMNE